ncbi:uncharacterized protein J4E78_007495 [Alternaria triticimaculans]|uniref:uncharacterized protein n=1 Tax=Alternaria triticimaculans TaxID=297637 RepID=UPI0020C1F2E3|nr:uncharacterized protein J4E78_007495 [Alternaria triticimaculans]KAI4654449.1 hypothetical protein J4E78_007495 [Alternaria triticimaculans]
MDHWGDPWADNNADEQKSPTKHEVTSPPPLTLAPAPVLLNGFLDDAGWGNEDEGFGDWTTSSGHDAAMTALTETRIAEPSPLKNEGAIDDGPRWDLKEENEHASPTREDAWGGQEDTSDVDNVTSDTSDTSTTIQPENTPIQDETAPSNRLQPDDESSARPSTSPSETSRTEAPVESPRTSFEEETCRQQTAAEEPKPEEVHAAASHEDSEVDVSSSSSDSTDDEFGTFTQDTLLTEAPSGPRETTQSAEGDSKETLEESAASRSGSPVASANAAAVSHVAGTYQLDTDLFNELFPSSGDTRELEEAPDDPIYSTSGRKAWYRLTRKQTMREFNSGNADDNYIRVTWAGSQVRSEVNKTVARWAREDRLSGTGPGARASFYWDTPAPPEPKTVRGHLRTKTTIPTPRVVEVVPARQSMPPVSTDAPAAFNWSSPTTTVDPWKQDSPGLPPIILPVAPKHNAVEITQANELRAVSIDLTRDVGETHGQTPSETPVVATKAIPPPEPTTTSSSPWGDITALDTNTSNQEQRTDVPAEDDDDWGEMISSPTASTFSSAFSNSIPATLDSTVSNSASPPKTPPTQDRSAEAMHIVRLRSTISPTSAIFGPKSFVPFHAEQGPIGPGLLKPAKRSVSATSEKSKVEVPSRPISEVIPQDEVKADALPARDAHDINKIVINEVKVEETGTNGTEDNDFSAFTSNTHEPEPARPSTPPSAPIARDEPTIDAWADADFSFFESAPATKASAPATRDPSDPFSVFETPPRPSSAASSAKTFTRSPPRTVTPPPIQPLTGATNSAQRRKNDEEQVIKSILAGLPDLSHMLRR